MNLLPKIYTAAAVALAAGLSAVPANAADLDGRYRDYGYNDRYRHDDAEPATAARHRVPDDFDEDNDRSYRRRPDGRHWGGYGQHSIQRIEARASYASDYLPYYVKEMRARGSAIDAWKAKVASRYGEQYAHWRMAIGKQVSCDAGRGNVYCTVSATPVIGTSRWGWAGNWR